MGEEKDLYSILGISRDAKPNKIKKAYRKLAMKYHPDKNRENPKEASKKFTDVAEAFEVLNDPDKRRRYDKFGIRGIDSNFESSRTANDIFQQFFKEAFSPFSNPFEKTNYFTTNYNTIVTYDVYCTLEELYHGTTKKFNIKRTNLTSNRPLKKLLVLQIKPGWKQGTRVTYKNEGNEISPNIFENICFIIREKEHTIFTRKGANLHQTLQISLLQSIVEEDFVIKDIDNGDISVSIKRSNITDGFVILKGKGMPKRSKLQREAFGDMIIQIKIDYPDKLTEYQKEQLKKILGDEPIKQKKRKKKTLPPTSPRL